MRIDAHNGKLAFNMGKERTTFLQKSTFRYLVNKKMAVNRTGR